MLSSLVLLVCLVSLVIPLSGLSKRDFDGHAMLARQASGELDAKRAAVPLPFDGGDSAKHLNVLDLHGKQLDVRAERMNDDLAPRLCQADCI